MIQHPNQLSVEKQKEHKTVWGDYNTFPPGWREMTEEEFAKSEHFTYTPALYEHRQMLRDMDGRGTGKPCVGATLFWQHDNIGFALVNDHWGGKIRFFKFGCEHEAATHNELQEALIARNVRIFSMQSASLCKKCKNLRIVDSSD